MNKVVLDTKSKSASLIHGENNIPLLVIDNKFARCMLYLYGAHITSFQIKEEKDILFMSPYSPFEIGRPLRGGIPICFPWFGKHQSRTDLPLHGFVRTQIWSLKCVDDEADGSTTVVMTTTDDERTRLVWPYHFSLTLTVSIGQSLSMVLEVENTDDSSFMFEQAFHTYYSIGDLDSCRIEGLDNLVMLDRTKANAQSMQVGAVTIGNEFVRIYKDAGSTVFLHDYTLGRTIRMHQSHLKHVLVWNPGNDAASVNPELMDAYKSFLCVEQTNCLDASVFLQSGEKHTSSLVLSLLHGKF